MAIKEAGIRLTLQGQAAYLSGLKSISFELKAMSTQSKLAVAQLGSNAKQHDILKTSAKNLANELKVSEEKTLALKNAKDKYSQSLSPLKEAIRETADQHQKAAKRTEELKQKYDEIASSEGKRSKAAKTAKAEYEASKTTTHQLAKEVKDLTTTYDSNMQKLGKLPNEINKSELASQNLRNELESLDATFKKLGGNRMDLAQRYSDFGARMKESGYRNMQIGNILTTNITQPLVSGFKSAIVSAGEFQSEIGALGPLLSGGKAITTEVRQEMDLLGKSSRQWAKDYGKGTSEINAGMSELIRNGYTSSQVMGMIPNILDASIASGEGFNTVMTTSSQVLSQFNLKGKTTEETLANTQRVTDSLTYVANATASGFSDLGAGMAYVGPVANSLNMSVEETASILGVLSNKGIEASAGGTALRGALTKLLKPSKQNATAMAELGISAEEFQKGTVKLPDIIDRIKENTKGWTDEQRAAAIATAFGTEAQTAMNALVEEGGDSLRKLTKEAEGASGATKQIAESMKELPEFKYQQLMAEVKDLGIELGTALLPVVMDVMGYIKELVTWFSNLDDGTKEWIIRIGLLSAALGPLLTTFGALQTGIGYVSGKIGDLFKWFGKNDSILSTVDALDDVAVSATNAGASATLFSNPWVLGAAAVTASVAGIGLLIYQEATKYDRAHQESVNETQGKYQEWFDAVTSGAVEAAESQKQIQEATTQTGETYEEAAQRIKASNKEIQDEMERLWKNNERAIREKGKYSIVQVDSIEKQLKKLGIVTDEAMNKLKDGFNNHGTMLSNSLSEIGHAFSENQVITEKWGIAQSEVTSRITEEVIRGLESRKQAELESINANKQFYSDYQAELDKVSQAYENQIERVQTSQASINHILSSASSERRALNAQEVVSLLQHYNTIAEGAGKSLTEIKGAQDVLGNNLRALTTDVGLNFLEQSKIIDRSTADQIRALGSSEEAVKVLSDALKEYGLIEVDPKEFEIKTEGKEGLTQLIESIEDYNKLTMEEKIATLSSKGNEEIQALLVQLDLWDKLDPTQQELILNSSGHELVEKTIHAIENWNTLSPEDKAIHIESQVASQHLKDVITELDLWNNTEFQNKFIGIDTNAPDAEVQITNLVNEFREAQGLPPISVAAQTENFDVVQAALSGMPLFASAAASDMPLIVAKASTDGVETSKAQVQDLGATADANANKSVSVTSNLIGMVANLVTMGLYNVAAEQMTDKTVSATTSTPNMSGNTTLIKDYNTKSGEMKDTKATASTYTPSMAGNTNLVMNWNRHTDRMKNKSSTMTTYTPGIQGNTSSVHRWNSAVNAAYSKTVSFTTYHDKVYRTFGKHATGGHIDAYATGGNLTWAGMFANGGGVPVGYTGIVGEAGPEIFQVTKKGVNITPLSTREKMRGIEGVLDDYNGGNKGQTVNININIDGPVLKEEQDIDTLTTKISQRLKREVTMSQIFNKGRLAT